MSVEPQRQELLSENGNQPIRKDQQIIEEELERLFARVLIKVNLPGDDEEDEDEVDLENSEDMKQLSMVLATGFLSDNEPNTAITCAFDWKDPVLNWLKEYDENVAELLENNSIALEILLDGIFAMFSLPHLERNSKFVPGDHVLALMKVDQEWHPAKVEKIITNDDGDKIEYFVRFEQFGNPQLVQEEELAIDQQWLLINEEDDSACKVCHRVLNLTFHHLIPKETHAHVLKRSAKGLIPSIEALYQARPDRYKAKSRKDWLEVHGIDICRPCHSQIHRVESNISLAMSFNTLESILTHPEIIKWRTWASQQK
jgi:hypothetical protein